VNYNECFVGFLFVQDALQFAQRTFWLQLVVIEMLTRKCHLTSSHITKLCKSIFASLEAINRKPCVTIFCLTRVGHGETKQLGLHCNQYWPYISIDPRRWEARGQLPARLYTEEANCWRLGSARTICLHFFGHGTYLLSCWSLMKTVDTNFTFLH
jgi:hypothetical protein